MVSSCPGANDTPEAALKATSAAVRAALARQLLAAARAATPALLEGLVSDLMLAMGYGGWRTDAARKIAKSADGGIDGVINEDRPCVTTCMAVRYPVASMNCFDRL